MRATRASRGSFERGLAAALLAFAASCASGEREPPAPVPPGEAGLERPFPAPQRGLAVRPGAAGEQATSLGQLVDEFAAATGWAVLADAAARQALDATPVGLDRAVDVPARDVYPFVETLLVQHGFAFAIASPRPPRILRVVQTSRGGSSPLLAGAVPIQVEPGELDEWARSHPGFALQTLVVLEHVDGRELSNALRPLVTDVNVQAAMPVGQGRQMILVGFAPWLRQMRDTVRALDQAGAPAGVNPSDAAAAPPVKRAP